MYLDNNLFVTDRRDRAADRGEAEAGVLHPGHRGPSPHRPGLSGQPAEEDWLWPGPGRGGEGAAEGDRADLAGAVHPGQDPAADSGSDGGVQGGQAPAGDGLEWQVHRPGARSVHKLSCNVSGQQILLTNQSINQSVFSSYNFIFANVSDRFFLLQFIFCKKITYIQGVP